MSSTITRTASDGDAVTEVVFYTNIGVNGTIVTKTISTSTIIIGNASPTTSEGPLLAKPTGIGNGNTATSGSTASSTSKSQGGLPKVQSNGSASLSTGAKAGIGVGVGLAAVLVLVLLVFVYRRRRRRKDVREISGGEAKMGEKKGDISRGASAKNRLLPMWKSELSGESERAELDATAERKRAELESVRGPAELDATGPGTLETPAAAAGELQNTSPRELSLQKEGEVSVNPLEPPPIPYASKPRPG